MERARILRNLMKEQHMKVADIVKKTGIAYSTVKSILENGIEKTSYVNVCKICDALGITTDQLEELATHTAESPDALSLPDPAAAAADGLRNPEAFLYHDMESLIARNGRSITKEQKLRLIQLLSEFD